MQAAIAYQHEVFQPNRVLYRAERLKRGPKLIVVTFKAEWVASVGQWGIHWLKAVDDSGADVELTRREAARVLSRLP